MDKKYIFRNGAYVFLIIIVPYMLAWMYTAGISYYRDVLTWNTSINGYLKAAFYVILVLLTMIVLIFHSELSYRVSKKLKNGKIVIVLINVLYLLMYPVALYFSNSSLILSFIENAYIHSIYTHMFTLSCLYSVYNVIRH